METHNRPIVLLGSGLETGHPDQGPSLFIRIHFAVLKTVEPAHLLPSSPVLLSHVPARICLFKADGSWIFSIGQCLTLFLSFFFFFFGRKLCSWRVKPSKGSVSVDRLAKRTVCPLTVALEKSNTARKI